MTEVGSPSTRALHSTTISHGSGRRLSAARSLASSRWLHVGSTLERDVVSAIIGTDMPAPLDPVALAAIITSLGTLLIAVFTIASVRVSRNLHRAATAETMDRMYQKWWVTLADSKNCLEEARGLPTEAELRRNGVGLAGVLSALDANQASGIFEVLAFFDEIGWLCAAQLVDADRLLPPMQHVVRICWRVFGEAILNERGRAQTKVAHDKATRLHWSPLYFQGFEWLYKRTQRPSKSQARLIKTAFVNPSLGYDTLKLHEEIEAREVAAVEMMTSRPSVEARG
jgi:hypothetical protein